MCIEEDCVGGSARLKLNSPTCDAGRLCLQLEMSCNLHDEYPMRGLPSRSLLHDCASGSVFFLLLSGFPYLVGHDSFNVEAFPR